MFEDLIKKTIGDMEDKAESRINGLEIKIDKLSDDLAEIKTILGDLE